ncbi:MAG: hypothetical protein ACK5M8_22095 [Shewanella algae]
MKELNALAKRIYEQNKAVGWWDNPQRCILTTLQLVSTEICEGTEGVRKNLMDTHLQHRLMDEVEQADAVVRCLDLAGRFDIPMFVSYHGLPFDESMEPAAHHAVCTMFLGKIIEGYLIGKLIDGERLRTLVSYIYRFSEHMGYDLDNAIEEKLEYNKHRLDHSRESRAAADGKKF